MSSSILVLASGLSGMSLGGNQAIALRMLRHRQITSTDHLILPHSGAKHYYDYKLHNVKPIFLSDSSPSPTFGVLPILNHAQTVSNVIRSVASLPDTDLIYSSSDFLPDVIPAALRRRSKRSHRWIASLFLMVPNPLYGYGGMYASRFAPPSSRLTLYWLYQQLSIAIINRYADHIFITNDNDRPLLSRFFNQNTNSTAVYGGVDLPSPEESKAVLDKKYTALFLGRLHEQKGLLLLPDIWRRVINKMPNARLGVIGVGSKDDMDKFSRALELLGVSNSVDMLGFITGEHRQLFFKQSHTVIHPAVYDNFGMAALEVMAYGVPGIVFDLPGHRNIYRKGVVRIPMFNNTLFAEAIIRLAEPSGETARLSAEARQLAEDFPWSKAMARIDGALSLLTKPPMQ